MVILSRTSALFPSPLFESGVGSQLSCCPCSPSPPRLRHRSGDLTFTVTPELPPGGAAYAREMVLLRLRGVYRTQILLEDVRQPRW